MNSRYVTPAKAGVQKKFKIAGSLPEFILAKARAEMKNILLKIIIVL